MLWRCFYITQITNDILKMLHIVCNKCEKQKRNGSVARFLVYFFFGKNCLGGYLVKREYIEKKERGEHKERKVKRWKNEYKEYCEAEVKRPKKVWGITEVYSPSIASGEKPVKADDIYTHL